MISDILLKEYKEESAGLKSLVLTDRQLCDIELVMNGAFAPLKGFLGKDDYDSVINILDIVQIVSDILNN